MGSEVKAPLDAMAKLIKQSADLLERSKRLLAKNEKLTQAIKKAGKK